MNSPWRGLISKIRDVKRAGAMTRWSTQEALADGGKVDMPTSSNGGWGFAQIGDGQEYGFFSFTSAGAVTLISNSANTTTTENNDGKFNIFDSGSVVGFNNELAAELNLFVIAFFN